MIFESILLYSTLIYAGAVFFVLRLLLKPIQKATKNRPFVSVVIAARNEAQRIKPTLDSLLKINYPTDKFEVIWVDDASQDGTAEIIKSYSGRQVNWQLIQIKKKDQKLKGKKAALNLAIEQARGEIILTTDADCRVPENWLTTMAAAFDNETIMVLGHSVLEQKKGFLDKLLRFDNLFSGIMVAAPTLAGFPISSVGRNMAYRKSAYLNAGGFDQLSQHKSGDDVHLTELFRRKLKGKITFCSAPGSFTFTKTPDSFKEIFLQQIRKNSKLLKKSLGSVLLALLLFFYLIFLLAFPFYAPQSIHFWLSILAIKMIPEFITLVVAAKKLGDFKLVPFIPFMQIFYPVYVTIFSIIGIFQVYDWKR
jgi:cellulose synthase/poly-beta-1,6-N-acetylglucosamine synthase-like glycosyltransferase